MLLATWLVAAPAAGQPARLIRLDDETAAARLGAMRSTWGTRAEWLARSAEVRAHLASVLDLPTVGAGGVSPASSRGPLRTIVHQTRRYDGYVVEDVSFESFDGTRVSGNLYRPAAGAGPFAGVLCPHGHFGATGDDPEGRFRRDMQVRCATLARMGAVVFAYDMVGWGESDVVGHDSPASLPLQTWNSIRAVDYLCSRGDVDPGRLAITGASGGGTQTFLLTALDPRIDASVPVVMVSSHFFGGCECETGLPIHSGGGVETGNVEIAAMAAPRPMLLVSCGGDWTSRTPEIEYPFARDVYGAFGAEDRVANAHFPSEGHDYGPSKRRAMYAFLAEHLSLDIGSVRAADGSVDESSVVIEPRDVLRCLSDARAAGVARRSGTEALASLRAGGGR